MTLPFFALLAFNSEPQFIVRLRPNIDPAAVAARANVELLDSTPDAPFALFRVSSGTARAAWVRLMSDRDEVAWVRFNEGAQNPETTSIRNSITLKGSSLSVIGGHDDLVAQNENVLAQVDWSAALADSDGRTVRLAILDNGLSRKQAGLWEKVDASMDVTGGDADDVETGIDSDGNGVPDEAVGHGTMVAGLADTVAPKVRLVIAKVADSDGIASAWSVVKGLAFAVNSGAEVANVSLGSPRAFAAFSGVADWCDSKGLLIVAPIGNAGENQAWYPARSPKALCVAGLNSDDTKASFSNWDCGADSAAAAVGITSQWSDGCMGTWSGTSFSSPIVAAGIADCLRRTSPKSNHLLIWATNETGRNVDPLNYGYRGKIGTVLDIIGLDRYLQGRP